ncbi:MAG: phage late control D family protein, partial [Myxococcales bacterium]|nr:phage late control D family protein [Myxococcales bacterium]
MSEESFKDSYFELVVDGTKIEGAERDRIKYVRVFQYADGPDRFEFAVHTEMQMEREFPNASAYKLGAAIEIKTGFDGTGTTIFKGEVSRIEGAFGPDTKPTFKVIGFSYDHRLSRQRLTEHWESQKYSYIVSDIAGRCGLSADCTATSETYDYVSMNNQTYLSFVLELARRVGYEVTCDDKKLVFKPADSSKQ